MLIEFRVSNYKSFRNVQVLSLKAGKVQKFSNRLYRSKQNKLLKFLSVYGANASGKSNLISALDFAKTIVLGKFPSNSTECYCRLNVENKDKPSLFEFTIELNKKVYRYGFEVILSSSSFVSEWLYEIMYNETHKVVFERRIKDELFIVDNYFKNPAINERLIIYSEDIKKDDSVLFLTLMNQNKDSLYETNQELKIYKFIYNWFKYKLSVNSPDRPITSYSSLFDNKVIQKISCLLSMFGTGVSQIELIDIPVEELTKNIDKETMKDIFDFLTEQRKQLFDLKTRQNPIIMLRNGIDNSVLILELDENNKLHTKTLQFSHSNTDAVFSFQEESDGTVRLFDMIEVLLNADNDKVFVIDEINRRFHPLLTYKFVEKYLELADERNIQLIVSTHESKLMDFKLLRKDEISFVSKNDLGETEFYSLERFGERFDKKIVASYLQGEYGAIPIFQDYQELKNEG